MLVTFAADGVECFSCVGCLPRGNPQYLLTGGWVDPIASLIASVKRNTCCVGNEGLILQ